MGAWGYMGEEGCTDPVCTACRTTAGCPACRVQEVAQAFGYGSTIPLAHSTLMSTESLL